MPQSDRDAALPVRHAVRGDVPALVALVNGAYRGDGSRAGWTTEADLLGGIRIDAERMLAMLATEDQRILVHEHAGELLACVALERDGEGAYLGMLTIAPRSQAAGLGRRLLAAAEHEARRLWNVPAMHMTVIAQRTELIAWYERRGYRLTGETEPFPYGDERFGLPLRPDLHFVVMRKALV